MRRWCWAAAWAVTVGCIEPRLTPCDQKVCAADKICGPEGDCIYPEQLTACQGSADGTNCTYRDMTNASCEQGVCQPRECGNGIKTSDEACDDGNNANGDGCSADCTSAEVCGNAITDYSVGEQCDDANDENFDDCRNDCILPHCGDGHVDPLEECEDGMPVMTTCRLLGYYTGSPSCTNCRFDPMTCSGQCGDQIVQTAEGEECDDSLPAFSCVGAGFDYGAITCSPYTCTADTAASCRRFGWRHLRDAFNVVGFAADGDLMVLRLYAAIEIGDSNGWTHRDGSYVDVDVRAGQILAATATMVEVHDQAWTTLPALPAGTPPLTEAVFADDGTPMVLATDGTTCSVLQLTGGTWSEFPQPTGCRHLIGFAFGDFVVMTGATLEWHTPTATGSYAVPCVTTCAFVDAVKVGGNLEAYAFDTAGHTIYRYVQGVPGIWASGFDGYAGTDLKAMFVRGPELYARALSGGDFLRAGYGRIERAALPLAVTTSFHDIYRGRDGTIYALGDPASGTGVNAGLYVMNDFVVTQRYAQFTPTAIGVAEDGALVACDDTFLYVSRDFGFDSIAMPTTGSRCTSIWASSRSDIYIFRRKVWPNDDGYGLYHRVNNAWVRESSTLAVQNQSLTGEGTRVVGIAPTGGVDFVYQRDPTGAWIALPALPDASEPSIVAVGGGTIYAATNVSGGFAVWKFANGSWSPTPLYSEASSIDSVSSVYPASDGTVFIATSLRNVIVINGTATSRFEGVGNAVRGTSKDDVFALRGGTIPIPEALQHWNGSRWSTVRTDPALLANGILVTPSDVLVYGPQGVPNWQPFIRP